MPLEVINHFVPYYGVFTAEINPPGTHTYSAVFDYASYPPLGVNPTYGLISRANNAGSLWDFVFGQIQNSIAKTITAPNQNGTEFMLVSFVVAVVPTLGEWALIIMSLAFLSLGTIALRRYSARPEIKPRSYVQDLEG